MTEFNLSEKILWHNKMGELMSLLPDDILLKKDVKEFIRLLKDSMEEQLADISDYNYIIEQIDKLVGEELTK